jgi:hypothetical protein
MAVALLGTALGVREAIPLVALPSSSPTLPDRFRALAAPAHGSGALPHLDLHRKGLWPLLGL